MMREGKWLLLLPCVLLMARPAMADEAWSRITEDFEKATKAWAKKLPQDKSEYAKALVEGTIPPNPTGEFRPRIRKYAEQHAGETDAVPALVWLVTHEHRFPLGDSDGENADWALKRLGQDHATEPILKDHVEEFQAQHLSVGSEALVSFLDTVTAKNPDKETRAWAQLVTAVILSEHGFGIADERGPATSKKTQRSEDILRSLVKEYAGTKIAEKAESHLFVTDYFQEGMLVPDTVGKDVDGNEIRLSDYRGKVVMIAFWATWCTPCMQAISYERELMKTYAGKPFTVLGINVDHRRSACRDAVKKEGITWPNIYDGVPGAIAGKWHINSFPTVVMLDHKGVIRSIDPEALGVDALVAEAVAAKTDSTGP